MSASEQTEEKFTLTDDELSLVREFHKQPELSADAFRRTIILTLSHRDISNPTAEQILDGKNTLLDEMRAEIQQ